MIRVDKHQWRLYVAGKRVHHGFVGAVMSTIGFLLMAHDRADYRDWFRFGLR